MQLVNFQIIHSKSTLFIHSSLLTPQINRVGATNTMTFYSSFLSLGQLHNPYPHGVGVQGQVQILEVRHKAEDPDKPCIDQIPFHNHQEPVIVIGVSTFQQQSDDAVDLDNGEVGCDGTLDEETGAAHETDVPPPHFLGDDTEVQHHHIQQDEEVDRAHDVQHACPPDVDGANGRQVSQHRQDARPVHVPEGRPWIFVPFGLPLEPPEDHMEYEGEETAGAGHGPSEDLGLRVVAGGLGDSSVREWWLLLVLHRHVVGVRGCQQHQCQVEVDHVVEFECPQGLFGMGCILLHLHCIFKQIINRFYMFRADN